MVQSLLPLSGKGEENGVLLKKWSSTQHHHRQLEAEHASEALPLAVEDVEDPVEREVDAQADVNVLRLTLVEGLVDRGEDGDHLRNADGEVVLLSGQSVGVEANLGRSNVQQIETESLLHLSQL